MSGIMMAAVAAKTPQILGFQGPAILAQRPHHTHTVHCWKPSVSLPRTLASPNLWRRTGNRLRVSGFGRQELRRCGSWHIHICACLGSGDLGAEDGDDEVRTNQDVSGDGEDVGTSGRLENMQAQAANAGIRFRETTTRIGQQLQDYLETCKSSVLMASDKVEAKIAQRLGMEPSSLSQYMGRKGKELRSEVVGTAESVYSGVIAVSSQPLVKCSLLGLLILYAFSVAWAARVLLFDKKSQEAREQFGRELRLQKLREGGAGPPLTAVATLDSTKKSADIQMGLSADDAAFRDKVREIRSMARAVRIAEQEVFSPAESGFVSIAGGGLAGKESADTRASRHRGDGEGSRKEENKDGGVGLQASDVLKIMQLGGNVDEAGADAETVKRTPELSVNDSKEATLAAASEAKVASREETSPGRGAGKVRSREAPGPVMDSSRKETMPADATPPSQNGSLPGTGAWTAKSEATPVTATESSVGAALEDALPSGSDAQVSERSKTLPSVKLPDAALNGSATVSGDGAPSLLSATPTKLPTNGHAAPPHVNGVVRPASGQPQKFKSMRVIISPEEARARIAAKKAKEGNPSAADSGAHPARANSEKGKGPRAEPDATTGLDPAPDKGNESTGPQRKEVIEYPRTIIDRAATEETVEETITDESEQEAPAAAAIEEQQEEEAWMRDEVLRAIVFKVRDNEQAGRASFDGLDSEAEQLFFKGLERKFEREGEAVKTWIQERVENLDYGLGGVSVDDPPESYLPRWKDPEKRNSKNLDKFKEDRKRIMQQQMGLISPEPKTAESTPAASPSTPASPAPPPAKPADPMGSEEQRQRSSEGASVSSSSCGGGATTVVTSSGKQARPKAREWQHTRKWVQELQLKYDLEADPEERALMEEVGQDLDRWITEDEIEEAGRLLAKGAAGEQEYARLHYEKTREKIQRQHELFGAQGMLNKYGEYRPAKKESELWWLDLPFVLCIGLTTAAGADGAASDQGLYSLDMTPNFDGIVGGEPAATRYHTVAFQDQREAANFRGLLLSERHAAEVIPFAPKDLYQDAKHEGFKVTVLKKGELGLAPGQALEDVEQRIVEIGSAVYWEELEHARSIDIDAVLDEGLGYGRPSS